mgnify:FL=1|tara:strand:+ start:1534 stop:2241 length:708 start_codon:yes stop_codon:yes gene_type:complete
MKYFLILSILALVSCTQQNTTTYTTKDAEEKFIKSYPDLKIDSIEKINNSFFEILIGEQIFYLTTDLNYLLAGNVIDINSGINLTQQKIENFRLSVLDTLDKNDTIIYKPEQTDHVITVFTDITCPYCKKLHNEISNLLENNIEVRYVLFPRNGIDDDAYTNMSSLWCSENRKNLLEKAFDGDFIDEIKCDNPLMRNLELAYTLRVNGTPMIFTESGKVIPGYVPYKQILSTLNN